MNTNLSVRCLTSLQTKWMSAEQSLRPPHHEAEDHCGEETANETLPGLLWGELQENEEKKRKVESQSSSNFTPTHSQRWRHHNPIHDTAHLPWSVEFFQRRSQTGRPWCHYRSQSRLGQWTWNKWVSKRTISRNTSDKDYRKASWRTEAMWVNDIYYQCFWLLSL